MLGAGLIQQGFDPRAILSAAPLEVNDEQHAIAELQAAVVVSVAAEGCLAGDMPRLNLDSPQMWQRSK